MTNTLDLDDDFGGIELLMDVENTFSIQITDQDAERCRTVGDVYDLIRAQATGWNDRQGACASAAVFYRIRRVIGSSHRIAPGTPLADLGAKPGKLLDRISRETQMRLPSAEATSLGNLGIVLCFFCVLGLIIGLSQGAWDWTAFAVVAFIIGAAMVMLDPLRFPKGITTVGDLTQRIAPLNVPRLHVEGKRPPDIWTTLTALAAEHGVLSPEEIEPDTLLIA